jgi:hypothetical protein
MFEPDRSPDDYLKMLGSVPLKYTIVMYNIDVLLYWLQRGLQVNGKSFSCENYLLLVFFILLLSSCHHGSWADPWKIQEAHAQILARENFPLHVYMKVTNFEYSLKLLRSSRIDSKESIPPAYVAWLTGTTTLFLLGS